MQPAEVDPAFFRPVLLKGPIGNYESNLAAARAIEAKSDNNYPTEVIRVILPYLLSPLVVFLAVLGLDDVRNDQVRTAVSSARAARCAAHGTLQGNRHREVTRLTRQSNNRSTTAKSNT